MVKNAKQKAFKKKVKKEIVTNKVYELQYGKTIHNLRNSITQLQYPLIINLIPVERKLSNDFLSFGSLVLNKDKKACVKSFNNGVVGLKLSQNQYIMLNVLAILISNSNFQIDIKNKDVDLTKVKFSFTKKVIRELSGITDVKSVIGALSRLFVFKTNNRGGEYVVDRLFHCKEEKNSIIFRFSKFMAYDYLHKSDNGYAKRRGFYDIKRKSIYETLFLELLFAKTAVFKNNKLPEVYEIKLKTLLHNINLYNLAHENKKRAVALLNDFIKASFNFGVFVGQPPEFEVKDFDRNSKAKLTITINPDFDWTNCDWDKWNTKKI